MSFLDPALALGCFSLPWTALTIIASGRTGEERLPCKRYFPQATHEVHESKRAAVVGLGELKETGWDPLFTINHFLAYSRAKVNRLNRRTWCTTKDPKRLADHMAILIDVFCEYLAERWKCGKGVCPVRPIDTHA